MLRPLYKRNRGAARLVHALAFFSQMVRRDTSLLSVGTHVIDKIPDMFDAVAKDHTHDPLRLFDRALDDIAAAIHGIATQIAVRGVERAGTPVVKEGYVLATLTDSTLYLYTASSCGRKYAPFLGHTLAIKYKTGEVQLFTE